MSEGLLPPVGEGGPFQIGGERWPGLAKLAEESGELLQVVGKILAYPDVKDHPDGTKDLRLRLETELADLIAATAFLIDVNNLDYLYINRRIRDKQDRFNHWHETILAEK